MVDVNLPLTQLHMVQAARRYYLDDASKVQIAEELGISRFKVARLLEAARDSGVVRIEILDPGAVKDQLSQDLRERFGLRHALVVDVEALAGGEKLAELGRAAASLMQRIAQPTDVIGLPWSRMVAQTVPFFEELPPVPIVQLSGALDLPAHEASPVDVVRDAARLTGGEPRVFYAPLVATDAEAARVIRAQTAVAGTLDEARHCSLALVGIGGWSEGESTLYDLATEDERDELERLEVVGEIAGSLFNTDGEPVESGLSARLVSMSPRDLRLITEVVAVSHGAARAEALRAGIKGGYVTSAVVDTELARALLGAPADASASSTGR